MVNHLGHVANNIVSAAVDVGIGSVSAWLTTVASLTPSSDDVLRLLMLICISCSLLASNWYDHRWLHIST